MLDLLARLIAYTVLTIYLAAIAAVVICTVSVVIVLCTSGWRIIIRKSEPDTDPYNVDYYID